MNMYSLTMFKSQYDNKTHKILEFAEWKQFRDLLWSLSTCPLESKRQAQLISPARYVEGTTRSNRSVTHWGKWACVDVDDIEATKENIRLQLSNILGDTYHLCYSTASCTTDKVKFRIVFRLSRNVNADEVKGFWFALNKHLKDMGDAQTKDMSRMYFIPATYNGADNWIYEEGESDLDVDLIMREYPYTAKTGNSFLDSLPDEIREQVIQHRMGQMDNTNVSWTNYHDCPFFPKRMAMEYKMISGTGWYALMFKIMVSTACNAVKNKYPITQNQLVEMCKQLDAETGGWYESRPLDVEAERALKFAYSNSYIGG